LEEAVGGVEDTAAFQGMGQSRIARIVHQPQPRGAYWADNEPIFPRGLNSPIGGQYYAFIFTFFSKYFYFLVLQTRLGLAF
jgi:hypothetical protein